MIALQKLSLASMNPTSSTTLWYSAASMQFATTYRVSLDPNDGDSPDIKDGTNP